MKNEFIKVLAIWGFALTFFLSCTDNPNPAYPDIGYFISSSSSIPSSSSSSSSVPSSSSIFSSSSIASSSSSKPSSSSSMPSSSSSSAVPSSSSFVVWSDDVSIGTGKEGMFADIRDNKIYKWVRINDQIWMAENLKFLDTNDNTSACYGGEQTNCNKFGRLYDWYAAVSNDACPKGWYLPDNNEWNTLKYSAGGNRSGINLRSKEGWTTIAIDSCTDLYSFNALPGGFYDNNRNSYYGGAKLQEQGSYWWSAGNAGQNQAPHRAILYNSTELSSGDSDKDNLLSVRCIRR